jgi:hypothetical protein
VRNSQRRQARLATVKRREPFTSTFVLLFLLAFSDELLYLVGAAVQPVEVTGLVVLLVVDGVLLALVLFQIWRIRRRSERRGRWTVWLYAGVSAAGTLGTDVLVKLTDASENPAAITAIGLVSSVLYVLSLTGLVAAVLQVSPRLLVRSRLRTEHPDDWHRLRAAVPLLVGTFASYLATAWWDFGLAPGSDDGVVVDQQFFAQISQFIPLLIVALGIEANFFKQLLEDMATRAAAILSVAVLCLGEVLALSVLAWPKPPGEETPWFFQYVIQTQISRAYTLHNYAAFLVTSAAALIGIATLIWVLVIGVRSTADDKQPAPDERAPELACSVTVKVIPARAEINLVTAGAVGALAVAAWAALRRARR